MKYSISNIHILGKFKIPYYTWYTGYNADLPFFHWATLAILPIINFFFLQRKNVKTTTIEPIFEKQFSIQG